MPEMEDSKFKNLHNTLHEVSKQLKETSVLLAKLAESLHSLDKTQTRLVNE